MKNMLFYLTKQMSEFSQNLFQDACLQFQIRDIGIRNGKTNILSCRFYLLACEKLLGLRNIVRIPLVHLLYLTSTKQFSEFLIFTYFNLSIKTFLTLA